MSELPTIKFGPEHEVPGIPEAPFSGEDSATLIYLRQQVANLGWCIDRELDDITETEVQIKRLEARKDRSHERLIELETASKSVKATIAMIENGVGK